jgi:hypothetical protein
MVKSTFDTPYWEKINKKERLCHYVADEFIAMLFERSQSENSNYKGDFQRSVRSNEVRKRMIDRGIENVPTLLEIGRTINCLVEHYQLRYRHNKRNFLITYSRVNLIKMREDIINIMKEDSLLYQKTCLLS